jgi:hypothetical protein
MGFAVRILRGYAVDQPDFSTTIDFGAGGRMSVNGCGCQVARSGGYQEQSVRLTRLAPRRSRPEPALDAGFARKGWSSSNSLTT